ncbi:hypothetical protein EZV62_017270 [Acer yangbiense]|uniref:Uncharacterized protein n=1 Tax=Acer yangbiense TaxID=1000413 RepID=A0A5C7HG56_9ROSI|nr:hypothetical protein EZV62_017270 [Acer yangbiense]
MALHNSSSRFELSNEYGANETGRIRLSKRRKKRSVLRGCRTTSSSAIHSRIDSQSLADSLSGIGGDVTGHVTDDLLTFVAMSSILDDLAGVQELKPKCCGNPVRPYENEVEKPGMKVHTQKKGESKDSVLLLGMGSLLLSQQIGCGAAVYARNSQTFSLTVTFNLIKPIKCFE